MSTQIVFNPTLDVFRGKRLDPSIEHFTYTTVNPMQAITQEGPYSFNFRSPENPIFLNEVFLRAKIKMTKPDGTAIDAAQTSGPLNNILHTLFEKVDVALNSVSVSHFNNLYGFQSVLEELITGDKSELPGRLYCQGWLPDTAGKQSVENPEAQHNNVGLKNRRDQFLPEGKSCVLIGRLHCDLFKINKCLLDNVELQVTLHRAPPIFSLIGTGPVCKLEIQELSLHIPLVQTSEALRRSWEATLKTTPARYDFIRTSVSTQFINSGLTEISFPALFRGRLPHAITLALVKHTNRVASYANNSYVFEDFQLSNILIKRNNRPVVYDQGLSLEFSQGGQTHNDGFLNYLLSTGKLGGGALIESNEFNLGNAIYPFQLVARSDENTDANVLNTGVLDLELKFKTPLQVHVNLLVLAKFTDAVYIDFNRNVTLASRD